MKTHRNFQYVDFVIRSVRRKTHRLEALLTFYIRKYKVYTGLPRLWLNQVELMRVNLRRVVYLIFSKVDGDDT